MKIKKINRRGQFYLLAAIIIIAVIIGFATITNYAKSKSNIKLYDLGEELGIEGGEVLDYGTINGEGIVVTIRDSGEVINIMEHFTALYDLYAGENKKIYYVFGNNNNIKAYNYIDISQGTVSITVTGVPSNLDILAKIRNDLPPETITKTGDLIKISIGENIYDFDLKPGENFYFVISQEIGEEEYIVKS